MPPEKHKTRKAGSPSPILPLEKHKTRKAGSPSPFSYPLSRNHIGRGQKLEEKYKEKEVQLGIEALRNLERYIMLNIVDAQWKDHLLALDHLKEGIGLRGDGQKDPLVEYKRESYYMFQAMLDRIDTETIRYLFNFQVK